VPLGLGISNTGSAVLSGNWLPGSCLNRRWNQWAYPDLVNTELRGCQGMKRQRQRHRRRRWLPDRFLLGLNSGVVPIFHQPLKSPINFQPGVHRFALKLFVVLFSAC